MNLASTAIIEQELIQYGFAGMSMVLIGIIVWLITKLIEVIQKNNSVIAKLIDTIKSQDESHKKTETKIDDLIKVINKHNELFLVRPCMLQHKATEK